jgi:hypothetical protein
MNTAVEIKDALNHCTGTSQYHRFSPFPFFPVATDGVKLLADMAECYWLLDVIGSYQLDKRLCKQFQVWTLDVNEDESAIVKGYNDTELIIEQEIEWTTFPMETIKLYLIGGVLLLPSEY